MASSSSTPGDVKCCEVVFVNQSGNVLCSGEGASREAARNAAFADALRRLSLASKSLPIEHATLSSEVSPSSTPSLETVAPDVTAAPSAPAQHNQKATSGCAEYAEYWRATGSTKYAVVGKRGAGKLSACLNLAWAMSDRYKRVSIVSKYEVADRARGLPSKKISQLDALVADAIDSGDRHAVIVDGVPYGGGYDPSVADALQRAVTSGAVDVFLCAYSMEELVRLKFAPDVLFIAHGASAELLSHAMPPNFSSAGDFGAAYRRAVLDREHCLAVADGALYRFQFKVWYEMPKFPARLLA